MRVFLVVTAALALAAFTYLQLERLGRRALVPLVCRAVAWSALGLLLLNLGCPVAAAPSRPLVLLDGSLSMSAAGGRWREARDSAVALGDVRIFGDERGGDDSLPTRGRSLLLPALTGAAATARPVVVVTDGEIEDAAEVPGDILARTSVRVLGRRVAPDLAITSVSGPARITGGDSLVVEAEVQALGGATPESAAVALSWGEATLARRTVALGPGGSARVRLRAASARLPGGEHVLRVSLPGGDAEPRTDVRLHAITVVSTPGVVLLAAPADWDSRFLYDALTDVAQLPVRGYARIEPGRWRSLRDLSPAGDNEVRQAARRADLLVLKGEPPSEIESGRARGVWRWPSGEGESAAVSGDWYLQMGSASPLDGAFAGAPIDSFAPAVQLVTRRPADNEWVALSARNGRRGPEWPAVTGRDIGRAREVSVLADGLWRWAFRGGASELTYRAWVAATVSWLLGGADSVQGVARPVRRVVQNGRPLVFEWIGGGSPKPTVVHWTGRPPDPPDTLRFDGAGRAEVWRPPGVHPYRLSLGGRGTVAVEVYSEELLPRVPALASRESRIAVGGAQRSSRDLPWLFLAALLGLTGEWVARRRMGLR